MLLYYFHVDLLSLGRFELLISLWLEDVRRNMPSIYWTHSFLNMFSLTKSQSPAL